MADKAQGSPSKDFFISMITRDISLTDCILDLLDNSIDGARRSAVRENKEDLSGYRATIKMSKDHFVIADNCGGIAREDAEKYAFHFGRRPDAPEDVEGAIGVYGIGMKRAIFKIGKVALVESRPNGEAPFSVSVNVDEWRTQKYEDGREDWDFDIKQAEAKDGDFGTTITLTDLYPAVASAFSDGTFVNEVIKTAARDYAFLVQSGFSIEINDVPVPDYKYQLKSSDKVAPAVITYEDDGVSVRIVAGLIQELEDEVPDELKPIAVERFGWYVVCNDRVVLAADKTSLTVWGNEGRYVWHPQYNGFAGFLFLSSDNPGALPWTTTKRQVDPSDPLYLRAVKHMTEITDQFVKYTNERKADLEAAKAAEKQAPVLNVVEATGPTSLVLPRVSGNVIKRDDVTIVYKKPRNQIKEVAEALGNFTMSASDVGRSTFEYFRKMELGK